MRPVVIVDPLSSGIELAPTFNSRGVPAIAVTLETEEWPEFGSKIQASDFTKVIPNQPNIDKLLKEYDPIGIIPGTEEGLSYILSIPLCAFLLSRRPVRNVLTLALALFIAGNGITLFSMSLPLYIAGRFVAGLGGGLFLPVAVAAGSQLVQPEFRGRSLSLMWGASSAGAVIGVPIGLWIAEGMSWRTTVILILTLAVFALLGITFQKQNFQIATKPPTLKDQFQLLTEPSVLAVVGVTLLTATGCLGLYSYISQVLAGITNAPEIAFSLWSTGGLIGSTAIGYVVDRVGKPEVVMGVILSILLVAIASIPVLRSTPIWGLVPFLVWGAMGWASVTPQQYSLMKVKADHEAILVALNSSAVSLGSVVGTALGGVILANGFSPQKLPYATSMTVFLALSCQLLRIQSMRRKDEISQMRADNLCR